MRSPCLAMAVMAVLDSVDGDHERTKRNTDNMVLYQGSMSDISVIFRLFDNFLVIATGENSKILCSRLGPHLFRTIVVIGISKVSRQSR